MAVVGHVEACRNQGLDWMTGQVVLLVAEYFLHPPVGQHEHAVAVGQHRRVCRASGRDALAVAEKGLTAVRAERLFWPNETVWHVAAATEATQGLPAWLVRDYVP
jgi:hypothetical protein